MIGQVGIYTIHSTVLNPVTWGFFSTIQKLIWRTSMFLLSQMIPILYLGNIHQNACKNKSVRSMCWQNKTKQNKNIYMVSSSQTKGKLATGTTNCNEITNDYYVWMKVYMSAVWRASNSARHQSLDKPQMYLSRRSTISNWSRETSGFRLRVSFPFLGQWR